MSVSAAQTVVTSNGTMVSSYEYFYGESNEQRLVLGYMINQAITGGYLSGAPTNLSTDGIHNWFTTDYTSGLTVSDTPGSDYTKMLTFSYPVNVETTYTWKGYITSYYDNTTYKLYVQITFKPSYRTNDIHFSSNVNAQLGSNGTVTYTHPATSSSNATKTYSISNDGGSSYVTTGDDFKIDPYTGQVTISKAGTYIIKCHQDAKWAQPRSYGAGDATYTLVVRGACGLKRKDGVNATIYRSLPDGLNVSYLFTSNTTGSKTYTLKDSSGNTIALTNGTTLPSFMSTGTYTITCNEAETATSRSGSVSVTLKIVGVYQKSITYGENTGTGSYRFDILDMTKGLGVTTPIYVWSAYASSLTQNGTTLGYNHDNTGNYRTFSTTDLTLKMPNTTCFEFRTTSPTCTMEKDNRTEANKQVCTEMKTDFIVEYNRAKDATYSASGHVYSYYNDTSVDYLRYTINISPIDGSGFWPVPAGFNKTGGSVINNVVHCPLTLGGSVAYNSTAGTNDDLDYGAGKANTFTNYTRVTTPANGNATTLPTTGTYYKFTPEYSGYLLTVGIKLSKRCKFWLLDHDKSTGTVTSLKKYGSGLETWRGANGTVSLFTQAGHEYYFFSTDEPLAIYGYHYSKNNEKYYESNGFLVTDKDYTK